MSVLYFLLLAFLGFGSPNSGSIDFADVSVDVEQSYDDSLYKDEGDPPPAGKGHGNGQGGG